MRKLLVIFILFIAVGIMVNCSPKTTKSAITGSTTDTKPASSAKVYTTEQMELGKAVWSGACLKCHKAYEPASHTKQQWEEILPRMVKKAKLDAKQTEAIYVYIMTGAHK